MQPDQRDDEELDLEGTDDVEEELDEEEDLAPDDLQVRDRTYERFGEQGVALATYAVFGQALIQDHVADGWTRGAETVGLGAPVGEDGDADAVRPLSSPMNAPEPAVDGASAAPADDIIQREVDRRVREDDAVDASELAVSVRAGEVILAGSVPHPVQRERAMRVASSVRGVQRVTSRLHVAARVRRGGVPGGGR